MKSPESTFTCSTAHGTIVLSERERGKNMWTVFNTNTHEILVEGLCTEVEAMMWISIQPNKEELGYAPF